MERAVSDGRRVAAALVRRTRPAAVDERTSIGGADGRRNRVAVPRVRRRADVVFRSGRRSASAGGGFGDAFRARLDDAGRCVPFVAVRAVGGRRSLGVRGGKDQEDGFRAAARRVGDGRYGARQPALSERRRIRFAEPGRNPSDGGRPADPGRFDRRARIPGAESFGQHVQRRFDFLFPPFGRRLPRSQAAPLPGSDRPSPVEDEYERVQHAQYALRHRAGSTDGPVIRAA